MRHSLDQVPAGSSVKRLENVLIPFIGREHNNLRFWCVRTNLPDCFYTAHIRQAQIHQRHRRQKPFVHHNSLSARTGFPPPFHSPVGNDPCDPNSRDGVIVNDENTDKSVCSFHHQTPASSFRTLPHCKWRCTVVPAPGLPSI